MVFTHTCLVFHFMGSYFVRNQQDGFVVSVETPARKQGVYSLVSLKACTPFLRFLFAENLSVAFSSVVNLVVLGGWLCINLREFALILSSHFLPFFLACLQAMDPISLMFALTVIFAILEGFDMDSSPTVHFQYSSLLGSLTCLGVAERYPFLKSY